MIIPPVKIHFTEEDRKAILQQIEGVLASGQLTLGKHGKAFEERFASYVGARYAVAVNSGTGAMEIALRVLGVQGKTVLVPTNTFFATVAAVIHAGAKPRFVDADSTTFGVGAEGLKKSLCKDAAGVIVVHVGGIVSPEMPAIQSFCREQGLFLLEDAAHAHGCSVSGRKAGTFGDAAAFSFYPTKVITSAEGGMIVTDNQRIYEEALIYRDQGKASFLSNVHTRLGYNWRMSEPHAIIGLSQLTRLEEFISRRTRIARLYDEKLQEVPGISALALPQGCHVNYYKYIVLLQPTVSRQALKRRLSEEHGVRLSGEVYEEPCHAQPVFADYREGDFPVAEEICRRHICLPIYSTMSDEEALYVLASLGKAMHQL